MAFAPGVWRLASGRNRQIPCFCHRKRHMLPLAYLQERDVQWRRVVHFGPR